MADVDDIPNSPTSPKGGIADETVALQIQQWLDDWHYRVLHSSLGKQWSRKRVLQVAFDLLELNGVEFTPKERETFLEADENVLVNHLVAKFPEKLRQNFENLSLQLQMVITSMTRIRHGIECDNSAEVQEVLEADKEQVVKSVLKLAVVQASKEIAKVRKCQATWTKNMEKRLDRLTRSAELAEHAQQQLIAVEAQISSFTQSQAQKSKKFMSGMAAGQDKALMHTCFSAWMGDMMKSRSTKHIRDKCEQEALKAEALLMDYKMSQTSNIKNVLMRNAMDADSTLLGLCIQCWRNAVVLTKEEANTAAAEKAVQDRLAAYASEQKDNTMKVMQKMAAESDGQLIQMVFNAFLQYHTEYQKDKELEDAVKKAEGKVREHLEKKKEEAKAVLDRMSAGTDSGLLGQCLQSWYRYVIEEKKDRELEDQLHAQTQKFKSLSDRQRGNAAGVQTRVNDQIKLNLLNRCLAGWLLETKINRVEKYYTQKIDGKRRQLSSVQSLFKSFAAQLEQGLGQVVDGESSGRTNKGSKRSGGGKMEASVSLPDIHARP